MLFVYRKRKDSTDSEWHFHTRCSRWPETYYIQTRYVDPFELLCPECVRLESAMNPKFNFLTPRGGN